MPVEEHSHKDLERDLNGFGQRVNAVEVSMGKNDVRTDRNAEDITKLFTLVGSNAETIGRVEKSVASLTGKIAGAVAAILAIFKVAEFFFGK